MNTTPHNSSLSMVRRLIEATLVLAMIGLTCTRPSWCTALRYTTPAYANSEVLQIHEVAWSLHRLLLENNYWE